MASPPDLFQNIFSSIADGLVLASQDLKIVCVNQAVEEMFGVSKDKFHGQPLALLFPDQQEILDVVQETIAFGFACREIECRGIRKSSSSAFPLILTASPVSGEDGKPDHAILLIKDISRLKDHQQRHEQSDRMDNLGILALGMAHEIKNPLVSIGASAQLLLKELKSPEQRKFLEIVVSESDRINRMMERMLDFARPDQLEIRTANIHEILEEILVLEKDSLDKKGGRFIQQYDPSLPLIQADEDRLKQVFLNLIQNAIDAVEPGGEIRLVTQINRDFSIKTRRSPNLQIHLLVEVWDNGPGISEAAMSKLFTPFFSTKKKGNGLGLPISLKIIEAHQGKMKIVSEEGKGARAQVFLPLTQG